MSILNTILNKAGTGRRSGDWLQIQPQVLEAPKILSKQLSHRQIQTTQHRETLLFLKQMKSISLKSIMLEQVTLKSLIFGKQLINKMQTRYQVRYYSADAIQKPCWLATKHQVTGRMKPRGNYLPNSKLLHLRIWILT